MEFVNSLLKLSNLLSNRNMLATVQGGNQRVLLSYNNEDEDRQCLLDIGNKCVICWYCDNYNDVLSALPSCYKNVIIPMLPEGYKQQAEELGYKKLNMKSVFLRLSISLANIEKIDNLRRASVYRDMLEMVGIDTNNITISETVYGLVR